eukprot:Sspe_Gene.6474::Locus_2180_Transcript_2_2_Confidence_0.667_Length_1004::g.6474::m.6474
MYDVNRERESGLYLHTMIYSPDVPVFRGDDNELREPVFVDFVTAPAPNKKTYVTKRGASQAELDSTFRERVTRVISILHEQRCEVIVLGAWGCGVFGNEPREVKEHFAAVLDMYSGCFSHVVFAITDLSMAQEFSDLSHPQPSLPHPPARNTKSPRNASSDPTPPPS